LLPVRPFRATRINAPAVPAAVLQTTPESRSGLSLAHSDCPSPNSLNGVNVPWPTPSIRSELLTSGPFDFEFHSSRLRGEDQHSKSVARRQKSRVSIFTALALPFRTLRPSRSTRNTDPLEKPTLYGTPDLRSLPSGSYRFRIAAGSSFPVRYAPSGSLFDGSNPMSTPAREETITCSIELYAS
jgi:hypothetical protein